MGERVTKERIIKPLLVAGIGAIAYAGYRLIKNGPSFKRNIAPVEEAELPEAFQEKLMAANQIVTDQLAQSAALKAGNGNELHKAVVPPAAFMFSKSQARFAEIIQHGVGEQCALRSATIFPCIEEEGFLKISRAPNSPEERKGHQIYWGVTPEGIRTEARTFGSDGLEPDQALERVYDLVSAPDLEVISLDDILSRQGL